MSEPQKKPRTLVKAALLATAAIVLVLQFIPLGSPRTNPPVVAEPSWDSPRTRELFFRSCADCHSNETHWPWYSKVAPVSWLVTKDVREGREHFNVSEWNRPQDDAEDAAEEFGEGEMPPWIYLPTHPRARFSNAERAELVAGLQATFGGESEGRRRRGRDRDDSRSEED
jgi:mono/diheme cytochrome c family protein